MGIVHRLIFVMKSKYLSKIVLVTIFLITTYLLLNMDNINNSNSSLVVEVNPSIESTYKYEIISENSNYDENTKIRNGYTETAHLSLLHKKFNINDKDFNFCINFERYDIKFANEESTKKENKTNDSTTRSSKILTALLNESFYIKVSKTGKIEEFYGHDLFRKKIDSIFINSRENIDLAEPSSWAFTPKFLIKTFERILSNLPDSAITKDFSWKKVDTFNEFIPLEITTNFVVKSIADNTINILSSSNISEESIYQGLPIKRTGFQKGEIYIDSTEGMLLKSENLIHLKAEYKIGKVNQTLLSTSNKKILLISKN